MIVLRPLMLSKVENGQYALVVGLVMPPFNMPMVITMIGLQGREDLPEAAEYFHDRVMEMYEKWDSIIDQLESASNLVDEKERPQIELPDIYYKAFPDEPKE